MRRELVWVAVALILLGGQTLAQTERIAVGSKSFTESYLLAEMMAQLLEARGYPVERRFGFAGTRLSFDALRAGDIDVYPEYTGTIGEAILSTPANYASPAFDGELAELGLTTLPPFGFDNTYALTVSPTTAQARGLARISDLESHPTLRFGLSHEFRDRNDGWPALKAAYGLPQDSFGIEHGLAYRGLLENALDVTDAYSTDADLLRYGLVVLEDDRGFFPDYLALPLAREDLDTDARRVLGLLGGRLDDARMRALNAEVAIERRSFAAVAGEFLRAEGLVTGNDVQERSGLLTSIAHNTWVHLRLTGLALIAAFIAGLALALLVYRHTTLSRGVLYAAGLLQTVPSIALLALMIPLAGVGQVPAVIALFLYSLLPILRNTITALVTIDPLLKRVAIGMGLTEAEQLRHVYLPLALPHLLSGLRIAAVISIGTATLAAFIGAGGLGEPIVTGLALNDTSLILQGAVPAALLAVATELGFELLERRLLPPHLVSRQLSA
jgi:osmoprotectant transport system permease protein